MVVGSKKHGGGRVAPHHGRTKTHLRRTCSVRPISKSCAPTGVSSSAIVPARMRGGGWVVPYHGRKTAGKKTLAERPLVAFPFSFLVAFPSESWFCCLSFSLSSASASAISASPYFRLRFRFKSSSASASASSSSSPFSSSFSLSLSLFLFLALSFSLSESV